MKKSFTVYGESTLPPRANTLTDWKKYLLSCLRANVFPPVAKGLDFMSFVESVKDNIFETAIEQKEPEIEQEETENEHV